MPTAPTGAGVRVAIIHGPNLNLLGEREPAIYGTVTLGEIDARLASIAADAGVEIETMQSNNESAIIDAIHGWRAGRIAGAVINAGAYTHTSLAIADALTGVQVPYVEVHLSNVHARESIRQHSHLANGAIGVISGFGADSYYMGLRALVARITSPA